MNVDILAQSSSVQIENGRYRVPLAFVLLLGWLALGIVGFAGLLQPSDRIMVGALATAVMTVPLLALPSSEFRWFHPALFVAITGLIGIGLRSWYLLFADGRPGALKLLIDTNAVDTVLTGTLFLGTGLVLFVLGFITRGGKGIKRRHLKGALTDWNASWSWTNILLLAAIAIGLIATYLYIRQIGGLTLTSLSAKRYINVEGGGFSSGAFFSRGAAIPGLAALPVLARIARTRQAPLLTKALVGISFVVSGFAPFIGSSRADLLVMLIIAAIVTTTKSPLPIRMIAVALMSISLFLVMGSLRCDYQTGSQANCAISDQIEASILANENFMSVSKSAHIYRKVPSPVDFQMGRTFANAFLAPIPRVIWPEKPSVRADQLVGPEILGLDRGGRAGAPPGIIGELYLNWGWPGVMAGMFGFGWFLRWLWEWFSQNHSDYVVSIYAIVVTHTALRLPAGDFTGSLMPLAQGVMVVIAMMYIGSLVRPIDCADGRSPYTTGESSL